MIPSDGLLRGIPVWLHKPLANPNIILSQQTPEMQYNSLILPTCVLKTQHSHQTTSNKTESNTKWPFKVIQGHRFLGQ